MDYSDIILNSPFVLKDLLILQGIYKVHLVSVLLILVF